MGIVLRQSAKSVFANLLGVGLGAFNILWLFPTYLSAQEIGILSTLESASVVGSIFAGLGVNVITDRFFPLHKNPDTKHGGYFGFLLIYFCITWASFGLLFYALYDFYLSFYTQKSPEIASFFYLVFPFAGLLSFQLLLESLARVYMRVALPALFREVVLRVFITFTVLLYVGKFVDFAQVVSLRVWCYAGVCGLMLGYLVRLGIPFWYIDRHFFRRENILPIVQFGFLTFGGAISITLVVKLDVLMLGALLNQAQVGIFTVAFFIGNVLEIPRKSVAAISTPLLSQAWKDNNLAYLQKIYQQSSINSLIVGGWFFLGIWLNIDSLFAYIPHSEVYKAGKYVVLVVAITRLIDMSMGLNSEIITQSRYYLFNFVSVALLLVMVIVFNLWFIPLYGIIGASVGSLLSILASNVVKFLFLYIKFGFQPFTWAHGRIMLVFLVCFQIAWIPVFLPAWADIGLRSGLITLLYWSLHLAFRTSDEFAQLWQTLKKGFCKK
jgi:O-antigen/teichoic acid export membrane protein